MGRGQRRVDPPGEPPGPGHADASCCPPAGREARRRRERRAAQSQRQWRGESEVEELSATSDVGASRVARSRSHGCSRAEVHAAHGEGERMAPKSQRGRSPPTAAAARAGGRRRADAGRAGRRHRRPRHAAADVIAAANIAEAQQDPRDRKPIELLVTDVNLPDGDGMTLLAALRKHQPDATRHRHHRQPEHRRRDHRDPRRRGRLPPQAVQRQTSSSTASARRLDRQAVARPARSSASTGSATPSSGSTRRAGSISKKVDLLCNDLVTAYGELSQAARRRPHAGRLPQVRRRGQGPRAAPLPRDGLAAPPDRLHQRRGLARPARTASSSSAPT